MFTALAQVHGLLLRGVLWLLKQPLVALGGLVKSSIALLGEESRRWLGMLMAGLMILAICWVLLKTLADQKLALLLVLDLGMGWLAAAFKAAQLTTENRIWKTRQRLTFRKLSGIEDRLGDRMVQGMARATQGTPIEGAFRSNRADKARAQQHAQAAAEQEAAERQAAAERVEADRQAAAQQAEEQQRHLDALAEAGQPYA
jgi:hypothetical protein